jgi:hypothetical protein
MLAAGDARELPPSPHCVRRRDLPISYGPYAEIANQGFNAAITFQPFSVEKDNLDLTTLSWSCAVPLLGWSSQSFLCYTATRKVGGRIRAEVGGWPTFNDFCVCTISTEGAPSLRFLQGRVSLLPAQSCSIAQNPLPMRSWYPPFAKCAKDGAPTVVAMPAKSKAWATRPLECLRQSAKLEERHTPLQFFPSAR